LGGTSTISADNVSISATQALTGTPDIDGALFLVNGGEATITNSLFEDNDLSASPESFWKGISAINGGDIIVRNTEFNRNKQVQSAVSVAFQSTGTLSRVFIDDISGLSGAVSSSMLRSCFQQLIFV